MISQILCPIPEKTGQLNGICTVCGVVSSEQFARDEIFSHSTGSIGALAPLNTRTICAHCAALWKEPKVWARSIWATLTKVEFPTIAPDPKGERPAWRDVIRTFDASVERVAIISTDPKKRVWCLARVSTGENIALYLHDPSRGISELRVVNGLRLIESLCQIENWMQFFSKSAIERSLLTDFVGVKKQGFNYIKEQEDLLIQLRQTPEFIPALIIAQKEEL